MRRPRAIAVCLCILAVAFTIALLVDRTPPGSSNGDRGTAAATDVDDGPLGNESAPAATERDAGETSRQDSNEAIATGTIFVAQVDEVDRCIDPAGTGLILTDTSTSRRYETVVTEGGAAIFEDVEVSTDPREFRIGSALAGHGCFPDRITLARDDFTGRPPKGGVSLALIHIHELIGVVRDAETRLPIDGATVALDSFTVSTSRTDASGGYVVNLNEPAGTLRITADGYHDSYWHFPLIGADGETLLPSRHDFALWRDRVTGYVDIVATLDGQPADRATLTVTEIAALPLADAAVRNLPAGDRARLFEDLVDEIDGLGRVTGVGDLLPERLDESGRARLRVVAPMRLHLGVRKGDAIAEATVDADAGDRREVALELVPGGAVDVYATIDGEAAADVSLTLDASPRPMLRATTDAEGVARFRGLPFGGVATLGVTDANVRVVSPRVVALPEAGDRPATVELELARPTRRTGSVVDVRSGRPIDEALVTVARERTREHSDLRGSYTIEAVDGDTLAFHALGYREASLVVATGKQLPLVTMRPLTGAGGSLLAIRVVDDSGEVHPDVRVHMRMLTYGSVEIRTAHNVIGTVAKSENGVHGPLRVDLDPGESALIEVTIARESGRRGTRMRVPLEAGESRTETVVLRPPATVSGIATLAVDGSPVTDATVYLITGESSFGYAASDRVDRDGSFSLSGIQPGFARLLARTRFHATVVDLQIPPEGLSGIQLALRPSREIQLRTIDALDGRYIEARIDTSACDVLQSFIRGNTIPVPTDGSIIVTVSAVGYRTSLVTIDPSSPVELVVPLTRTAD